MLDIFDLRTILGGSASLILCAGCLTPPCNCAQAAAPGAAPVAAAAEASAPSEAAASSGDKQVVWDGDEAGTAAKGWADCDKKPDCKSTLEPQPSIGRNNSIGLKFHGEGPGGWVGAGWNLFGWWPKDAGLDVSGNTHLVFWMKIEAKSAEEAPDMGGFGVALKCSNNDKCISNTATISKYSKDNLTDGQWHEVAIPMSDLKKSEFDPKKVWEVDLNTWTPTPRNFNVFLDDISFQKR